MTRTLHITPSAGVTLAGLLAALEEARGTLPLGEPSERARNRLDHALAKLQDADLFPTEDEEKGLARAFHLLDALDAETVTCGPLPIPPEGVPSELLPLYETAPVRGVEGSAPVDAAGLAFLHAVCRFAPAPSMTVERAAGRDVRLFLGLPEERSRLLVLEANIDDMSSELLALLPSVCLEAGALDVWLTPVLMKKGRPAHLVSALCVHEAADEVERALFRHSSTLGVRRYEVERAELEREWTTVETPWGPVRVKVGRLEGEIVNLAPEFEDCVAASTRTGVPTREIMAAAAALARSAGQGGSSV